MTDKVEKTQLKKMQRQLAWVIMTGIVVGLFGGLLGRLNTGKPFPDGQPGNVTCKGSYTVTDEEAKAAGDVVVATAGDATLTNRQLQIYYWMAVDAYMAENSSAGPDLSQPLDRQLCDIDPVVLTWQQYFLQQALETWHRRQALELQAEEDGYFPGQAHQNYLDSLPGLTGNDPDMIEYALLLNRSYMYFADQYGSITNSEETVASFVEAHPTQYPESGYAVDIRHILLAPGEESQLLAQQLVELWLEQGGKEYIFAQLAAEHSEDAGSVVSGGLYTQIRPGMLITQINDWCFDEARMAGDYTVIAGEEGVHILYFRGSQDIRTMDARSDLIVQTATARIIAAGERFPMTADYSAIVLGETDICDLTDEQLLYPDVGHENITEVPWYFQNDYPYVRYGRRTVAEGGCGLTCFAMAATYLSDTEQLPEVLGPQMGRYSVASGSAWILFDEGAATLGIAMPRRTMSIDEVVEALGNGQIVVSVQRQGLFTTRGHYILLTGLTEDGRIIVQDPDRITVESGDPRLVEGFANGFTPRQISSASKQYWIFGEKQLTNPVCQRCGDGENAGLFAQAYICNKCGPAENRRQIYLTYCS